MAFSVRRGGPSHSARTTGSTAGIHRLRLTAAMAHASSAYPPHTQPTLTLSSVTTPPGTPAKNPASTAIVFPRSHAGTASANAPSGNTSPVSPVSAESTRNAGMTAIARSVAGAPSNGTSPKLNAVSGSAPMNAPTETTRLATTASMDRARAAGSRSRRSVERSRNQPTAGRPISSTPAIALKLSWKERFHSAPGSSSSSASAAKPSALTATGRRPTPSASRNADPISPARTADGGAPASRM